MIGPGMGSFTYGLRGVACMEVGDWSIQGSSLKSLEVLLPIHASTLK